MTMAKLNKMREQMINSFLNCLKEDTIPWHKTWSTLPIKPYNAVSNSTYHGSNLFWLYFIAQEKGYEDPRWCTFKQAKSQGWKIMKGSEGVPVEFWSLYDVENKKKISQSEANTIRKKLDLSLEEYIERFKPISSVYTVFNAAQIEGIPELDLETYQLDETSIIPVRDTLLKNMDLSLKEGTESAFYNISRDEISLPYMNRFENNYAYMSTFLHECAHATGSSQRLDRNIKNTFGSFEYAKEELRAEIASAFTAQFTGIEYAQNNYMENHKAYIQNWIEILENNPNELFAAIKDAEKISDYLIEKGEFEQIKEQTIQKQDISSSYDGTNNKRLLSEEEMNTLDAPHSIGDELAEQSEIEKANDLFVVNAKKALLNETHKLVSSGYSYEELQSMLSDAESPHQRNGNPFLEEVYNLNIAGFSYQDIYSIIQEEKNKKNTIVINAFAGPSAGKTTSAHIIVAELKKRGYVTEFVSEVAKEMVWDEKFDLLDGSIEGETVIYNEKKHRIDRLINKVDFIVTDSPTIQSICFLKDDKVSSEQKEQFANKALNTWKNYNTFNYFVERDLNKYEEDGRIHTLDESIEIDNNIKRFLNENDIYYGTYRHDTVDKIIDNIITSYKKLNEPILKEKLQSKENKETAAHAMTDLEMRTVHIHTDDTIKNIAKAITDKLAEQPWGTSYVVVDDISVAYQLLDFSIKSMKSTTEERDYILDIWCEDKKIAEQVNVQNAVKTIYQNMEYHKQKNIDIPESMSEEKVTLSKEIIQILEECKEIPEPYKGTSGEKDTRLKQGEAEIALELGIPIYAVNKAEGYHGSDKGFHDISRIKSKEELISYTDLLSEYRNMAILQPNYPKESQQVIAEHLRNVYEQRLIDKTQEIGKLEEQYNIPNEKRITQWYGDYNMYETCSGITTDILEARYEQLSQLKNEFVRKESVPSISFDEWYPKNGYDKSLMPHEQDLAEFAGGRFRPHTKRSFEKIKATKKRLDYRNQAYKEYEKQVKTGAIPSIEKNIPLDLNKKSDRAYCRMQIKKACTREDAETANRWKNFYASAPQSKISKTL